MRRAELRASSRRRGLAATIVLTATVISGLYATPVQAATIVFSGVDGTAGTNEIQFFRPPAHAGTGLGNTHSDLSTLTTDFGQGPLTLQTSAMNDDPARLLWDSGPLGTIDESDPTTTYAGFGGSGAVSVSGAAFDGGAMPLVIGTLFSGNFVAGMNAMTYALAEPCLYPSVCTGTITAAIASGGLLDPTLAAALGVKAAILGGFFTLTVDNIVYDAATGEVEGVVTTSLLSLQVDEVPAPPATLLLLLGLGAAWVRRATAHGRSQMR